MSSTREMLVGVIGLGKVGLPMAACIADAGYSVLGFDIDPRVSHRLGSGAPLPGEPGIAQLLHQNQEIGRAHV